MNRTVHLALVFALIGLSLVPLASPVAAQQTLPAQFVGRWEGISDELPSNADVPVTVDLTGGSLGAVVGTMAFPSHACGGDVTLQRVAADGRQIELAVSITYGTACINGGVVTLSWLSDGRLSYDWRHPTIAVTATGTLTRTGGTTGGTTGDAWCAQIAAAYGPVTPLSGPWPVQLEQRQGSVTLENGRVSLADFVATAMFYNPTTSTTVPWDYGFAFRQTADQREVQQIILDSTGTWYYSSFSQINPNQGVQDSGVASSFNFSPGAPNALDLVVDDQTASFCLNGRFVSTVQLPPAVASDVFVATGFFTSTLVNGRLVEIDRFAIWAR